jgi:crotonobetainyl-CoA:carnitine CoA-transferase CaiB-like acyl-CoA transferase
MWTELCDILGCKELIDDPRFITADDRKMNRAALVPFLEQRFLERTAEEWMKLCDQRGVPAGIVNTLDRVMTDPQIQHRGMIMELHDRKEKRVRVVGDPIFFEEARRPVPQFPPVSGADSETVLKEVLGLSDADINEMIDAGVLRAAATEKA